MDARLKAFERLLIIMDELREKCPWDQKQTFESLRNLTIEETYELADAITTGNLNEIKGEIDDQSDFLQKKVIKKSCIFSNCFI